MLRGGEFHYFILSLMIGFSNRMREFSGNLLKTEAFGRYAKKFFKFFYSLLMICNSQNYRNVGMVLCSVQGSKWKNPQTGTLFQNYFLV